MLLNFFKTAWRNLVKNKAYSAINIGGLSLGITVAILIGLWVNDELSFNKYHANYSRIAQLWAGGTDPETASIDGSIAMQLPMARILKNNYQHYFKEVTLAWWMGDYTIATGVNKFTRRGEFMEPGGPRMLTLQMLRGSYSALNDPHSIILSKSTAEAIFGKTDPIEKTLKINNNMDVKVTGVYADMPRNNTFSEVQFFSSWDLWVSANSWIKENESNWDNRSFNIYVQLQPGITMEMANAGIRDFYYKNLPKDFLKEVDKYKPFAQVVPMKTWHLYETFKDGKPAGGRITFIWLFGIVGAFVLLLACINFMNLSTARSEKRSKEVGIRKVLGSMKWQLVRQFMSESLLVSMIAGGLAILLVVLSISSFNQLADKDIHLPLANPLFWVIILTLILLTGILAGLYPSFYLSSFQPVKVLKGVFRAGRLAGLPRKVLVVVQFTVSVTLIIGTIIVYRQIQFARNRPVGYSREGLVAVPMNDPAFHGKEDVIKQALLQTNAVQEISFSSAPVTEVWSNWGGFTWKDKDPKKDNGFATCDVSVGFGKTVGWQFTAGRDFSPLLATDSAGVVINEAAARYTGLKNPVGEQLQNKDNHGVARSWRVLGVIKDMVIPSPYSPVRPTLFFLDPHYNDAALVNIKIKSGTPATTAIAKIGSVFTSLVPSSPFDYKFADLEYGKKFSQEERIGKLARLFAVLAVLISCLGLFGLASFVAEQRTKEIGIRKVVGASIFNLWQMLSKDFVVLVIISSLLAVPTAYYFMNNWLKQYDYRTPVSWWIFAAAIGGAMLVTLLTVSYQAIRAAMANPIKSLRTE